MLYRYENNVGINTKVNGSKSDFGESANVAGYAYVAMSWAVGHGIINCNLLPANNATRAEVSAMLMRMVMLFPKQ